MGAAELLKAQREYFGTGTTLEVGFRAEMLKRLKGAIEKYSLRIEAALKEDLGKSRMESYMCESGLAKGEISYLLRHIRHFAREKRVITPVPQFFSRCFTRYAPYGSVLIMSPWNYPVLLTLSPLADAIAAGNTAIVKPSAYSPATSRVLSEMIGETFESRYVAVVTGGRAENSDLLEQKFDMIFFTGSQAVGRTVMERAAKHLTPVVLELGGKSPCVVDETADIPLSARRIVWGKYLNCGQTCVAPDYVLCQRGVKDELVAAVKKEIGQQFGERPLENEDYGKIVNRKHFERILGLLDENKIVHGGKYDREGLRIEPTVMDNVTWDDAVMGQEIFGPVLPILTFDRVEEIPGMMRDRQKPLAFYVFSTNKQHEKMLLSRCAFGGGCVNDTVIHLAVPGMGFGGVGESGMGSYHGRDGMRAFSHRESIVDKKRILDLPMRYQPFKGIYERMLRVFLR